MRWLLALDTTAEFGSLALLRDGSLVEEVHLHSPDGFGHTIFGAIEALFARHELTPSMIDCFAGATGPGSFTGVRVGLTVIKGLADATMRPVVGISNLQAMATYGQSDLRAVVLDARRGEVYGAVFDASLRVVQPEAVSRFTDWLADLPEGEIEFIAQDFTPFLRALEGRRMSQAPRALAAAIGRLAWTEFVEGHGVDSAALDANYVRRSDAELLWKEM
jgi:tRNA threonylcarbamoyladenosine biosynthesis protein TsaB